MLKQKLFYSCLLHSTFSPHNISIWPYSFGCFVFIRLHFQKLKLLSLQRKTRPPPPTSFKKNFFLFSVLLSKFSVLVSVSLLCIQVWPVAGGQRTGKGGDFSMWNVSLLTIWSIFFIFYFLFNSWGCIEGFLCCRSQLIAYYFCARKMNTTHSKPFICKW